MRGRRTVRVGVLLSLVLATTASAQPPVADHELPVQFRRIFFPENRAEELRNQGRFLPKEPAEFERMVASVRNQGSASGSDGHDAIVLAEYQAQLVAADVLAGVALLEIRPLATGSRLLPLDPFGLALHNGVWSLPAELPAVLGTGADGKLLLKIDGPGKLRLDWSLRGAPDENGAMAFQLEIPPCPVSSLELILPAKLVPEITGAVVQPAGESDPGARRWRIRLGPAARFELKLSEHESESPRGGGAIVRQKLHYDLAPRGLQVAADFQLEIDREPIHELELAYDEQLQILRIVDEDQRNLSWTVQSSGEDGSTRALLGLAEPLLGPHHTISVLAAMPVRIGSSWRLPGLSLSGLAWQQGDALLRIRAPLVIDDLVTRECRQSLTGLLPAPNMGELIELQYFNPRPQIELRLRQRQGRLRMSSGAEIVLERGEVQGTTIARFSTDEGEQFEIDAELLPGWNIESLDSLPPQEVADWTVTPQGGTKQRLKIHLARPLSPQRPVWIVCSGTRARAAVDERVELGALAMWNVPSVDPSRRFMSLAAAEPYQLRLDGDQDLKPLPPEQLMDGEQALLFDSVSGVVFELTPALLKVQAALQEAKPQFSAHVEVAATYTQGLLAEAYRIRCVPALNSIDRVRVRLSPARAVPPSWSLDAAGDDEQTVAARKLSSPPAVGGGEDSELWEIALRGPRTDPFEIHAARASRLGDEQAISLASLPDATAQQGTLFVRAAPDARLSIHNRRLKPIPIDASSGRQSDLRMAYRYEPQRDAEALVDPPLRISINDKGVSQPAALIWRCGLDVYVEPGGHSQHAATYWLQNLGCAHMEVPFPSSVRLAKVTVDGTEVSPALDRGRLTVPLSADRPFTVVEIRWIRPTLGLFAWQSYATDVPLPQGIPVLSHSRTVFVPPGFSAMGADDGAFSGPAPPTIGQRLLGPLGREAGARHWSPLTVDWQELLGFRAPRERDAPTAVIDAGNDRWLTDPPWDRTSDGARTAYAWRWRSYQFDGAEPMLRVTVIRDGLTRAVGWAVFLLVAAWAWWQSSRRITRVVWAAGILGVVALLVPAPLTPVTSGAVLGMLFGVFAWVALPALPHAAPSVRSTSRRGLSVAARLAIFLVSSGILTWTVLGSAQEPVPSSQVSPRPSLNHSPAYRVFIPVNDHDKPTGGRYLVPEPLWQRLVLLAARASHEPMGLLIERARYRQSLTWDPAVRRLQAGNVSTTFELRVLGQPRVQLPLGRLAGAIALDSLRLDGLPVEFAWEEEGQVLAFDAGEPGSHQLDFILRPTPRQIGSTAGFEVPLLPVAASHFELSLPSGAPAVDVASAFGNVIVEAGNPRVVAELGSTDRLAVRWRDTADPASSAPVVDVHELLWLKVQSNSVVVSARLLLNVPSGSTSSIQLLADPHLRRLPLDQDDPLISEIRNDPADPRRRELVFSRPISGQEEIELTFLLTDASGVGLLRVPMFGVEQARHRRRWLAVSVSPALQAQVEAGDSLNKLTTADFVSKWGMAEEKPGLVYQLPDDEFEWRLATRPIEPRRSVDQIVTISAGTDAAQVQYRAELDATGHCFQHRLSAPAGLAIESLSVLEQGAERLAHWSRDTDGNIVLFLTAAAQGRQTVELRGRLPIVEGDLTLPRIALQADTVRSDEVRIYRQTSALLELQDVEGLQELADPITSNDDDFGRLVHRLAVVGPHPAARLRVAPNRPECQAVQVTSLHYLPEQDGWELQVEVELAVTAGVVDAVRFSIPPEWLGPHTLAAPFAAEIRHDLGESPRLAVRPAQAIPDHARFVLRGRLSPAQGVPLSVPAISIMDDFRVKRFLDLPVQIGLDRLAWDTAGLQPAELPAGFQRPALDETPDRPEREAFHVVRDDFRAVKTSLPASSEFPEVTLADYRVAYLKHGWLGSAAFDCVPGELSSCRLQIPADCRIAECRVAGRPAVAVAEGPQLWRLEFGLKRLPQRIELVFYNSAPAGPLPQSGSLEVPRLLDLPVRRTLWTVAGSSQIEPEIPAELLRSRWDHERIRLQSAASTVADAAAIAAEEPTEVVRAWYALWGYPLVASRDALSELLATERLGNQRRRITDALRVTLEQHSSVEQRLGVHLPSPGDDTALAARQQPALLWDWATNRAPGASTFVVQGESTVLKFSRHDEASRDLAIRGLAACCLLLATGLAALGIRRGWARNWGWRWPHAWAVALGLSWWLWLSPSALGWVWLALLPLLSRPAYGHLDRGPLHTGLP